MPDSIQRGPLGNRPRHANPAPSGAHTITAYAPGAALRPLAVHAGTEPETAVALRLTAGSEVTVDVREANGQPVVHRLETELLDGRGVRIDCSPLIPGNGPLRYVRLLVEGHHELRLRDHRGRAITVPSDGKPVQAIARFAQRGVPRAPA